MIILVLLTKRLTIQYKVVVQVAKNPILTSAWCTYQERKSDMLTWQNIRSQAVDYFKSTTTEVEHESWQTVTLSNYPRQF